ncbi:O-antigen ligase family protein [Parvularcula maris]|uniref:O-antigen ligase family protein n=1 Tax=Parvularcula maris TaxID=2965077 RepID=UPI002114DD8C|nr:O-antigen ligase family protein [Parvularcula maris]
MAGIGGGGALATLLFFGRETLSSQEIVRVGVAFGVLSVAFFLSPHPLIFFFGVVLTMLFYTRKTNFAVVFFIIILSVPGKDISFLQLPGINYVFDLSTLTILGFAGLWTAATNKQKDRTFTLTGKLLLAMLFFYAISVTNRTSLTNDLRAMLTQYVIIAGAFFGVASAIDTRDKLMNVIHTILAMAMVLAGVAIIGQLVGWNFYSGRARELLGLLIRTKSRGALLRMTSTFGQAYISFGIILASLLYFALPLIAKLRGTIAKSVVIISLVVGFLMSGSRTPFLAAAIGFGTLTLMGRNAMSRAFAGGVVGIIALLLLQLTPFGAGLLSYLPLVGERGTDDYRVRLFERGMDIIWDAPLFGDHLYRNKLEDLRQGEGIIDMVNTYLSKALEHGIPYTVLFVSILAVPTIRTATTLPKLRAVDAELAFIGASIVAGISVLMIGFTATSMSAHFEVIIMGLSGLAVAYNRIAARVLTEAPGGKAVHGLAKPWPGTVPA